MFLPRLVSDRLAYCNRRGETGLKVESLAEEMRRLIDLCCSGSFYETLCPDGAGAERVKKTKRIANVLMNSPETQARRNVIWRRLRQRFPHCFGIISAIKRNDHRSISRQLQYFTAKAINDALLDLQAQGVPAIPDTDSLIVREQDRAAACHAIGKAMFVETCGVSVTVGGVKHEQDLGASPGTTSLVVGPRSMPDSSLSSLPFRRRGCHVAEMMVSPQLPALDTELPFCAQRVATPPACRFHPPLPMPVKKSELYSSLWAACDELRGGMDASQYKDYVLVLLFIKYVSDKYAGQTYGGIAVPSGASFADMVAMKGHKEIGDRINKEVIAPLEKANELSFGGIDFNDAKLGTGKEMVDRLDGLIGIFQNPALDFSKTARTATTCWGMPMSTSCATSPRRAGRAKGSSTRRRRSAASSRKSSACDRRRRRMTPPCTIPPAVPAPCC